MSSDHPEALPSPRAPGPSPLTTILVVDDTPESLALLVQILTAAGYRVLPADGGESALAVVAANPPDLILLDVRMKGVDGIEVCRRLQASEGMRRIPIILISAFADVKEWVEGLRLGAADYITKPFQPEELLTRVKTHLALNRADVAIKQQQAVLGQAIDQLQSEIAKRRDVEEELRRSLDRAERARRAMLSTLEDQKQAEEQTALRVRQQAAIAALGQLALTGEPLPALMDRTVRQVAQVLEVELCMVEEVLLDHSAVLLRVGVGLQERWSGPATVGMVEESQAGFTLRSREPVIVEDLRNEKRFCASPLLQNHDIVSGLSTIIGGLERPYGILGAYTTRPRTFSVHDVHFLQGAANLLASAIQRKAHEAEIERMNRLYATLSQVNLVIVRCKSPELLMQQLCHAAVDFGKFKAAWVSMITRSGEQVTSVARDAAMHDAALAWPGQDHTCGIIAEAVSTGRLCLSNDAQHDERTACCHELLAHLGIRSCAVFPLKPYGVICGTLSLAASESEFFNPDEVLLLEEVVQDISYALEHLDQEKRRRQAEAERERLMSAIEQTQEAIVITDLEGTIQYVNPAFERTTGYSRKEALGQNPRLLKSREQDQAFYRTLWRTISSGQIWEGRLINKRKDGTRFTEQATISPVIDATGEIVNYVAVKRDITEHLRLESQVRQTQKMELVGRLAGGVAHDFNNMLSVILGFTELALRKVEATEPLHANLKEVMKAANRSADIVRQLLAFARKQTIAPQVLDLNDIITGMIKMLQRLIGEDIELVWLPGAGLWPVKMDQSQLDQILVNLCVNARDAIAGVGRVTIETGNATLDQAFCAEHAGFAPGEYALLAVSDNGRGMTKETLDRIFEPFFTTKETGKGTGLGLSTVYGIIKQNNCFIDVHSEEGQGTTFTIYLRRHVDQPVETISEATEVSYAAGGETLLVVEDELSILELAVVILTARGYNVLTANTPGEAMRLAEAHHGEIHLLITDVIMPELNGPELALRINAFRPAMKCLFMSGYPADAIAQRGVLGEGVQFIEKPFSADTLAAKVRAALNQQ